MSKKKSTFETVQFHMTVNQKKRFLVSPLEWGLGHATRLSALIEILVAQKHEVIIAADGLPYNFLANKFPDLVLVRLPIRQIRYSKRKTGFFLHLFIQMPGFYWSVRKSAPSIDSLVKKFQIDYIISDNRYGFQHPDIPSVFVTHQLRPMPPKGFRWTQSMIGRMHLFFLRKFDFIWVADFPGDDKVVGSLSQISWTNSRIRYIGPLSWCGNLQVPEAQSLEYDMLVMLSGPEPHRSLLEKRLIDLLHQMPDKRILMLQGLPQDPESAFKNEKLGNIEVCNHLPGIRILEIITAVPQIICRAGVVTVFDLVVRQRPALLIPTYGQTEQEYVAGYLDSKGYFKTVREKELNLHHLTSFIPETYRTFPAPSDQDLLIALTELLQQEKNQAVVLPDQHEQFLP